MEEIAVMKPARIEMGGLWKNTTKAGKPYLSGPFGRNGVLTIWPNVKREGMEGAKDPDYTMVLTEKYKKPDEKGSPPKKDQIEEVPF
jgi:hypothetical protein